MSTERTWPTSSTAVGASGLGRGPHGAPATEGRLVDPVRNGLWRSPPLVEKALLGFGLLALALVLPPWPGGVLVLTTACAAALAAGTPVATWLRTAAAPFGFILLGSATVAVSVSGGFALTGTEEALRVLVRGSAAVACLLLLVTTTPAPDLLRAAQQIGVPRELAEVALSMYRFIFLLDRTGRTIHASQAARLGHDGWRRSIRSTGLLAAALLPRALDRARKMEIGLSARGFEGTLPTLAPQRTASPVRLASIVALLATIVGVAVWM